MQILIGLAILAAALAVVAIVTFIAATRIAEGGPTKLTKGMTVKMDDSDKRAALAARLRWMSIICLLLLVADGIATYTFLNYANT